MCYLSVGVRVPQGTGRYSELSLHSKYEREGLRPRLGRAGVRRGRYGHAVRVDGALDTSGATEAVLMSRRSAPGAGGAVASDDSRATRRVVRRSLI